MKRKLSLLLAVVMILSSFSFVFADEEVNVPAFLEKNGILKGDKSGNLMLDKALERRDAVVLLSRLLKAEEEAKNYEPTEDEIYPDNNDPYYAGFLGWATANGYFEGYPNGNFKPRESILVQEFALVLLRALEYGDTEWKSVMDKAKELGILEGVKEADANAAIVREDVATMIFNALGVKMKKEGKTLAEFLGIEMPAPKELKATVKDTENLKEVVVELSNAKLVDRDKLENANNYKVAGNVVEKAELDGNNVIVLLRDALKEGKEYKLRIRSIDRAINGEYKFVARDNTIPSVEKVEVLGEYGIKVITSEPIKIKDGNRGRNFLVDGKNIAMNVESYGRNIILTPYYNESFSKDAKTLTITGLEDFAGFKSASEEFPLEIVKDEVGPKVVDVILRGNDKVEVVFDKDIYIDSVEAYYSRSSTGNISYQSGRHTEYADEAEKIDVNRVVYTFKDELLRKRTEFTIEGVQNHSKVAMEKTIMEAREVIDDTEPEIIDSKVTDSDAKKGTATLKIYFDKDVSGSFIDKNKEEKGFVVKDHFRLYEREVYRRNEVEGKIATAKYDTDKNGDLVRDVIVVELKDLEVWTQDNELDYILEVEDFTDYASTRNKMYRDYVEFKLSRKSAFTVEDVIFDVVKGDTEITIKFSKAVDRVIAEDPTNYIFQKGTTRKDVKDLKGKIVTEGNGKEVTLIIPDFDPIDEGYKYLRILDVIKDKDGNRLDTTHWYEFGKVFGGLVDKAKDLIAEAGKYTDADVVAAKDELIALFNKDAAENLIDVDYNKRNSLIKAIEKLEKALEKAEEASGILTIDVARTHNLGGKTYKEVHVITNDEGTITLKNGTVTDKLVIDAPKAHVVNELGVKGDVEIVAVAGDSFVNEGVIEGNVVVKTIEVITIKGVKLNKIVNGTNQAITIKLSETVDGEAKEVTIPAPAPATYKVTFEVNVTDATIVVKDSNGEVVTAEADGTYELVKGTYSYTVSKDGFKDATGTIEVVNEAKTVTVTLEAEEEPTP